MRFKGRGLATFVSVLLAAGGLAACATGADTSPGSAAPATDAADDTADDAAAPDSTDLDTASDAENEGGLDDASQDVVVDAQEDVTSDVTDDETVDAPQDAESDAVDADGEDVASDAPDDQSVADTSLDAPEDTGVDAQDATLEAEAGPDAPDDAPAEAPVEAATDSGCPILGCNMGNESRQGCANARVVGRKQAMGAGLTIADSTCQATNADDQVDPACWDSGLDHTYRIYLRQGESLALTIKPTLSCDTSSWSVALKIYSSSSTGCGDTSCASKDWCASPVTDLLTQQYTAAHEGWVTLVVDGYGLYDAGGYELKIVLTCNVPGCEC